MTSALSQMLDELMGKNRNAAPDDKGHDLHWSDKDVCKHFLCGFCPAELFTNTRSDLGPCQKIHDEAVRKTYEQSNRYMRMSYEEEFLHYLQQCMTDVERRIRRNHQRLQLSEEKTQKPPTPNKDVEDQIDLLTQRIEELLQKIEQLGSEGNVEEAQGVMKLCDQLKEDRENLYNQQKGNNADPYSVQEKQMEVCEVCGAFLIVGDAQSRVDDHLMGKQHMGYARIKAHVEELKEKLKKRDEAPPVPQESDRKRDDHDREKRHDERRRSRSSERKDRDRDRHDSRHRRDDYRRDRGGHRSDDRRDSGRYRDRDRDRDGRSSRDYRHRSRDNRDRKSSHRDRSRSRDRDRRHSRKHSRPRSRSKERKEHKRSRRSDSRDRKHDNEGESKNKNGDSESPGSSRNVDQTEKKDEAANALGEDKSKSQDGVKSESTTDPGTNDSSDIQHDGGDAKDGQVKPPGTEGDQ